MSRAGSPLCVKVALHDCTMQPVFPRRLLRMMMIWMMMVRVVTGEGDDDDNLDGAADVGDDV